jgi:hypothetical protein
MKNLNLLKQKLAIIASSAVLSDSVICGIDDAIELLDEYSAEIDKLRRHNASLIANGIQDALSNDEIVTNTLKNARLKVEQLLNEDSYKPDTMQYMYYCFGIRDACWAIDKMIKEQAG